MGFYIACILPDYYYYSRVCIGRMHSMDIMHTLAITYHIYY